MTMMISLEQILLSFDEQLCARPHDLESKPSLAERWRDKLSDKTRTLKNVSLLLAYQTFITQVSSSC